MPESHEEHRRAARNARDRARRAYDRDRLTRLERRRRDAKKRAMIAYLGGACQRCKRTVEDLGHAAAMDFHHRDPQQKRYNVNRMYTLREELRRRELDKCDLLCASCHRVIEATASDTPASGKGTDDDSAGPSLARLRRPRGRPPLGSAYALRVASARVADVIRREEVAARRRAEERRRAESNRRLMPSLFDLDAPGSIDDVSPAQSSPSG
jgi:hypothetical protein